MVYMLFIRDLEEEIEYALTKVADDVRLGREWECWTCWRAEGISKAPKHGIEVIQQNPNVIQKVQSTI